MERIVTTRYSDPELAEFEILIKDKLASARKELEFMRDQILEVHENSSNQQGGDYFDDSSLHTELEMLNQMVSRQRQFVQNLENALIRVKNKSYGICIATGDLIDKKRLYLVPHATKSVEAKNTEKEKIVESAPTSMVLDSYDSLDRESSAESTSRTSSRIITKVVKKTAGSKKQAPSVDDEDADLFPLDDDLVVEDDDYDYNDDMSSGDSDSYANEPSEDPNDPEI